MMEHAGAPHTALVRSDCLFPVCESMACGHVRCSTGERLAQGWVRHLMGTNWECAGTRKGATAHGPGWARELRPVMEDES